MAGQEASDQGPKPLYQDGKGAARYQERASPPLRFGSCFAGIGGFDLGLEAAGMRCAWQIELSEFKRATLAKHWPEVPRWTDVRSAPTLEPVELVCGGFPCQDISIAGKREGLDGSKSRLWYDMYRLIRRARPRWVVIENSPALRTHGADVVLGGLEGLGYSCWPVVVGAWAVGANHRRDRVWIIGHLDNTVLIRFSAEERRVSTGWDPTELAGDLADAGIAGREGGRLERILDPKWAPHWRDSDGRDCSLEHPEGKGLEGTRKRLPRRWPAGPVEPQHSWEPPRTVKRSVGRGPNGFPGRLVERRRKQEIEALGAAVVPQVAEALGRTILRVDEMLRESNDEIRQDLQEILCSTPI